jgi:hypothetical protein
MITKVREARNERLIRSPSTTGTFWMPYPNEYSGRGLTGRRDRPGGFFISGQTATAVPAHHEASSNAPHITIMFGC